VLIKILDERKSPAKSYISKFGWKTASAALNVTTNKGHKRAGRDKWLVIK